MGYASIIRKIGRVAVCLVWALVALFGVCMLATAIGIASALVVIFWG